ncbi:MAG: hypothetical protein GVY35_12335 [Bacteroidetes bacterium]|nr:hypothetical protein [Bacteroidota bacterium]
MHTWRTHSAWLLLVLLTLGGVVAPVLHQLQHDASHLQVTVLVQHDRVLHSEIDHTIHADEEDSGTHSFYCMLCHTQVLSKLSQQAAVPTPHLTAMALSATITQFVASPHLNLSLIRGPPVAA